MRNSAVFTHNDDAKGVTIARRKRLKATKDTHARIENVAFVALGLPCASPEGGHPVLAAAAGGIDSARRCGWIIHQFGA